MLKVFISQPMNGLSDKEIRKRRNEAIDEIHKMFGEDVEILDSFFDDYDEDGDVFDEKVTPIKYLARSIDVLADADVVYFVSGFMTNRGCRIEYEVANSYGKRVMK